MAERGTVTAKRKLDTIFSIWVRLSAVDSLGRFECYTCRRTLPIEQADAGHYISRTHMATRYLPANCKAQCRKCNRFEHGRPIDFREHLVEEHGEETVLEIERLRHTVKNYTLEELELAIDEYQEKLSNMPSL